MIQIKLAAAERDEKQCSEKKTRVAVIRGPVTHQIATVSLDGRLQRGKTRRCCNLQFGTSPLASVARDFVLTDR